MTGQPEVGDSVRMRVLPPWVESLPKESQAVFQWCLGKAYRVSEIDSNGLVVLDVGADIDATFGGFMNDIRLEPEYLERA